MRIDGFTSPAINWYKALQNQQGKISPIFGDDLYLNFLERVWIKEEHRWRVLRLTAFMNENGRETDVPVSSNAGWPETCVRVEAWPTFLGSFTPAVPSEVFMQLSRVGLSDFTRAY